jgi:kumamolisin
MNTATQPVRLVAIERPPAHRPQLPVRPFTPGELRRSIRATVVLRKSATRDAIAAVTAYAVRHGLRVSRRRHEDQALVLSGALSRFAGAFHVRFVEVAGDPPFRSFRGPVRVPATLSRFILGMVGFDARRLTRPMSRMRDEPGADPGEVARIYRFPPAATGRGQNIAILAPGGGFHRSDIETYFAQLGLEVPRIDVVQLRGAANWPAPVETIRRFIETQGLGMPEEAVSQVIDTAEVTGDIELAGALAPGARLTVYFAPPTKQGLYHAFSAAVHDERRRPGIINCSWGLPETEYAGKARMAIDSVLREAAGLDITVCCASGDSGSGAGGKLSVTYPASSRYVLACGGTHLAPAGSGETVWNDQHAGKASGGGYSRFPLPAWQRAAGLGKLRRATGRGVPDVSAKADIQNGYRVVLGGLTLSVGGGTSAAAPLWSALVARLNESLGRRVGHLAPVLYGPRFRHHTMRDVVQGNNGHYRARRGWDPCTGWGSPRGDALLEALRAI